MSERIFSSAEVDQKVITSDGKRRAMQNLLFTIIWNGIVFPVTYFHWPKLLKIFQEDPIFWVFISFPIIGIFLLYNSIADSIDWFKFGEAPLTLNNHPAYLGGNLSGFVDISTPHEFGLNAEVSLRCAHHYIDDSGSESSSRVYVLWQDDLLMPSQSHGGKTRVLFSFQIDEDLPQSQGKGSERHEWTVIVKLPVPGKDLVRSYIVPVDKHYPLDSIDTVSSPHEASGKVETPIAKNPALNQIQNITQTAKKYPQISTNHEGQRYFYPSTRNLSFGIFFLLASLFFGGMSFGLISAFEGFLPATSILFSIPFLFITAVLLIVGLLALIHRLEVVVGRSGISVKHRLLFYTYKGELKPSDIADIEVSRNGSSSNGSSSTVWYQLKVIDMDGMETTVGDSLEGSSYAKLIRKQMIDGLGHNWKPSEVVKKPGKLEKLKDLKKISRFSWLQKLIPLTFVLVVAYDLYNLFGGNFCRWWTYHCH